MDFLGRLAEFVLVAVYYFISDDDKQNYNQLLPVWIETTQKLQAISTSEWG